MIGIIYNWKDLWSYRTGNDHKWIRIIIKLSEDRRSNITQITEAPSDTHEKESRRCYYNPNFDKLLFDPPTTEGKKYLENSPLERARPKVRWSLSDMLVRLCNVS